MALNAGRPVSLARASSRKAERQLEGGDEELLSSGTNDLPSTKDGTEAPPSVAKVGARSLLSTISCDVLPSATPGSRTIKGTLMASSYADHLPCVLLCSPIT